MKKRLCLLASLLCIAWALPAQDDMYFGSSKKSNATSSVSTKTYTPTAEKQSGSSYSDDEIDRYNRRGYYIHDDTLYLGDGDRQAAETDAEADYADGSTDADVDYYDADDYYYSRRLARFHNPGLTVYVGWGYPYYWDAYYGPSWSWYYDDPWYWDNYYWYGWYRPRYYWGWHDPWWAWNRPVWHGPRPGYAHGGFYSGTRNHSFAAGGPRGNYRQPDNRFRRSAASGQSRFGTRSATFGQRGSVFGRSTGGNSVQQRSSQGSNSRLGGTRSYQQRESTVSRSTLPQRSSSQSTFGGSRSGSFGSGSMGGSRGGSFGGGSMGGSRGGGGGAHFGGRR